MVSYHQKINIITKGINAVSAVRSTQDFGGCLNVILCHGVGSELKETRVNIIH